MATERLRSDEQREQRAARILDVTSSLLLRHGARRVTIDDVAAGVGIGKGTVYLHWKTREQLFSAVFQREVETAITELRDHIQADPQVCRLHLFARTYFLAITARPLLLAFLLSDPDILGRLTSTPESEGRHAQVTQNYCELLATHGLLRTDLPTDQLAYAYQATFEGFLRAAPTPTQTTTTRADLLAQTILRAFEPTTPPPAPIIQQAATEAIALLNNLITPT